MNIFERKNSELIKEFNRYVREHPDCTKDIPQHAIVVMQIEGDEVFNKWSRDLAKGQAETGQAVIYVKIRRMKPLHSRIEALEL